MLAIYFGFILLLAFSPATLGTPLGAGVMTLGIPVGVAVIVSAVLLTGIYVYRANRDLDPLNERVRKECQA
ncbi:Inner membrane protein YjcH [compost metagenome]